MALASYLHPAQSEVQQVVTRIQNDPDLSLMDDPEDLAPVVTAIMRRYTLTPRSDGVKHSPASPPSPEKAFTLVPRSWFGWFIVSCLGWLLIRIIHDILT
ncbi:hypothetical protein [Streptosporangium sp. NPDC002524]|uniref:hypothetical protein n=1 Tax=Streptosporangium sp. NPDC002524 TaxID=3154537 RepID=UPI00332A05EA